MPIIAGGEGASIERGVRRTAAEFSADSPVQAGTSLVRRPDAIAFDYLTAFTSGPVALSDTSEGLVDWVWKARATENAVYLARANEAGTGWETETLLFGYSGLPILELDLAFEQTGRPVIVAQRATRVWIRYFNSLLAADVFEDFGDGRTPRAVLDNPFDVIESDVLVFYVDPVDGLVYRQQRDRYVTKYLTVDNGVITAPPAAPPAVAMDYGPVLFDGIYYDGLQSGLTAQVGDIAITTFILINRRFPPEPGPTSVFRVAPRALWIEMYFSRPVYGARVKARNLAYPQFLDPILTLYTTPALGANPTSNPAHIANEEITQDASGVRTHLVVSDEPVTALIIARPPADNNPEFFDLYLKLDDADVDTIDPGDPGLPDPLPPLDLGDIYLEDAVRTTEGRVSILYAARDAANASYELRRVDTVLYPFFSTDGTSRFGPVTMVMLEEGGELHQLLKSHDQPGSDGLAAVALSVAAGGELHLTLLVHDDPYSANSALDALTIAVASGILHQLLKFHQQPYGDFTSLGGVTMQVPLGGGGAGGPTSVLKLVLIIHNDPYAADSSLAVANLSIISGTLAA